MPNHITVLQDRIRWASAVLAALIQRARDEGWIPGGVVAAAPAIPSTTTARVPAEWLRARLSLAANQYDALWMLAAVEIEPRLSRLAAAFATPECPELSVQTLQQALAHGGAEPLTDEQLDELVGLALVETTREPRLPMHRRWIRIHDRFLELAQGRMAIDRDIAGIATLELPDAAPPVADLPAELRDLFAPGRAAPLVVVLGPRDSGRAALAGKVAASAGAAILRVDAGELSRDRPILVRQLRAVARESLLFGAAPLVENADALDDHAGALQVVAAEVWGRAPTPVFVTAPHPRDWPTRRPVIVHAIRPLDEPERRARWGSALTDAAPDVVAHAAARYAIGPGAIRAAAETARIVAGASPVTAAHVREGVRTAVEHAIGGLARRIETRQTWDDLVLPSLELEQIVELIARVRHRHQVLEAWGFAEKIGRGCGLTALLSGPPGTGKTMIAGLIANELGLDLYQIDLSKIVSKYIGETEKQLAAVFDAAQTGHSVLLFDEADALFARRSEVKSSNDRYANLETNYLLQRIEAFTGIVLLTTNHEAAIDDAFRRRLAMHVRFPMPDEDHRELLWRAVIPARAAVGTDLDFRRLAREFAMSGGYIKNAAVRAAYLAADRGGPISMAELGHAARCEYEATGRIAASSRAA